MSRDVLGLRKRHLCRTVAQAAARNEVARQIRHLRSFQRRRVFGDQKLNQKRTRMLGEYCLYLAGLDATLDYVGRLRSRLIVDIGMGAGHAFNALSRKPKYQRTVFAGIDMLRSPDLAFANIRITSAEVMRGFESGTVGAFISVFGPTHYTDIDQVFSRLDELLAWGGVIKIVLMKHVPQSRGNDEHRRRNKAVELFFRDARYDYAYCDGGYAGRRGVFRTYLAVKVRRGAKSFVTARDLLEADRKVVRRCARGYLPR